MRLVLVLSAAALVATACSSGHHASSGTTTDASTNAAAVNGKPKPRIVPGPAQRALGLPPVKKGPVPGYVLIADRNNGRAIIVSPSKRVVWIRGGLHDPDDAFFTPGYQSIITNEEFNDTLTEVALRSRQQIWSYGHAGVPGSSPGYLHAPDDAYRLPSGRTTVADIQNCRIVILRHDKSIARILGGSCGHSPPSGFASPNGDTPTRDGGLLVTEIGGWIDRLGKNGRLMWSVRSPVGYPSDAQLLPNGRILVASFENPGGIVIMRRDGAVTWSFGTSSGPNELNKPSLAVMWPNGMIAANDDYNQRVIVIDPKTKRIVWQYGHTGITGTRQGYLNKPDGLELLPSAVVAKTKAVTVSQPAQTTPKQTKPEQTTPKQTNPEQTTPKQATQASQTTPTQATANAGPAKLAARRVGSLPQATSRIAAVVLPGGRVLALGGLVGASSSDEILAGPPSSLRRIGRLPVATHDAAAALVGGAAYLFGGGEAVSTDTVVRVNPQTGAASRAGSLGEPLSDLGAALVGGRAYIVGGYTGAKYATGVLRFRPAGTPGLVTRLPVGLRYAGVASAGPTIYVAGGLATSGETRAVYAVSPSSHSVRRIATLPFPAAHAALASLGGSLYLIGGRSASGSGLASILRIDPASGHVSRAGRLPQPLQDPAAVTLGKHVVVLGGSGSNAVYSLG